MNGWAVAVICVASARVGAGFVLDGREKSGKVSAWVFLAVISLDMFILFKAGLFN
jgi:hypothetical protein